MTLLRFYWESDEDAAVLAEMARDWIEILGPIPQGAVAEACRLYLRDEPRKRPTPGAIRALAMQAMKSDPRLMPVPPSHQLTEAPRERCSPEVAAQILEEAGLTPARLAAITYGRRMPPPMQPGYEEPAPAPHLTVEEIAARPYTAEELARVRRNHGIRSPEPEWEPDFESGFEVRA